jgi:hypothetical protein
MTPEQRDKLLDAVRRDAFHLELKDSYQAACEEGPFARWRRGEPDDFAWHEPWRNRVRAATSAGKRVRRVRVVTEPLSGYIRWEHSVTWLNQEAGEDIRWLPRRLLPEGIQFPVNGNDFWIFDDEVVTVGHFDADGRVLGSELVTDPVAVAACAQVRDLLWRLAIPHREYQPV